MGLFGPPVAAGGDDCFDAKHRHPGLRRQICTIYAKTPVCVRRSVKATRRSATIYVRHSAARSTEQQTMSRLIAGHGRGPPAPSWAYCALPCELGAIHYGVERPDGGNRYIDANHVLLRLDEAERSFCLDPYPVRVVGVRVA
jgi:hypothetical protein